jgi:hypothetical protein
VNCFISVSYFLPWRSNNFPSIILIHHHECKFEHTFLSFCKLSTLHCLRYGSTVRTMWNHTTTSLNTFITMELSHPFSTPCLHMKVPRFQIHKTILSLLVLIFLCIHSHINCNLHTSQTYQLPFFLPNYPTLHNDLGK